MSYHLSPLELERNELGYSMLDIREGRTLRVIHKPFEQSDVCVFFVHGGGGRAGQFKHLIRKLEGVNVVAFDFLGHGDSPHIDDPSLYTADEHLQDLLAIFKKFKQHKNVYVSHSYGNIHVLRHLKLLQARHALDSIAGVVMIGLGTNAPVSIGMLGKLPCFVLEWLRPLARSASNAILFASTADLELIRFENSIADTNRMYMMRTVGLDNSSQAMWDRWLDEGKEALVGNNIPRVLVEGEEDGIFSLESCEKLKKRFEIADDCYHVLEGTGHLPMLDRAEEVSRILIDFLCSGLQALQCVGTKDKNPEET